MTRTSAPLLSWTLLLLLCVCGCFFPTAVTALTDCNCNNGLVRPTAANLSVYYLDSTNGTSGGRIAGIAPTCQCVCFDSYLLPRCLYTSTDLASIELWMAGPAQTNATLADLNNMVEHRVLAASALATMVANSFGVLASDNNIEVELMLWVNASFVWPAAAAALGLAANANVSTVKVMLQVPGWAAQYMVNDASQGLLSSYTVASIDGTQTFVAVALREYQPGPTVVPTFPKTWMRIYPSGDYWYMGFEQSGWFFGALLLTIFFFILEAKCMFNVDYNVGGGAVKYHHVRQEIAADEDAYYAQQKMMRKQQKQDKQEQAAAGAAPRRQAAQSPQQQQQQQPQQRMPPAPPPITKEKGG